MNSYLTRRIQVKLSLDGDTFDGSNNIVTLDGLRITATIDSYSGSIGSFMSQANLTIKGMLQSDMDKLSTLGYSAGTYNKNLIQVYAGDDQAGMTMIFSGGITYGNVNYNAMPDVGVELVASAVVNAKYAAIAASSYKGSMNVATMIQAIAETSGYSFQNAGVTTQLSNHATAGDALTQIKEICRAAGIHGKMERGTVYIWPAGGTMDNTIVQVNGNNGLVGYPMYAINGVNIRTLFNPQMETGRQVEISAQISNASSSSPFANSSKSPFTNGVGTFYVWQVKHLLSAETVNGPWFSDMSLGNRKFNAH